MPTADPSTVAINVTSIIAFDMAGIVPTHPTNDVPIIIIIIFIILPRRRCVVAKTVGFAFFFSLFFFCVFHFSFLLLVCVAVMC